jgi:hypothetical protein
LLGVAGLAVVGVLFLEEGLGGVSEGVGIEVEYRIEKIRPGEPRILHRKNITEKSIGSQIQRQVRGMRGNVGKYQRTGSSLQASISASYGFEKAELSTPDRSTKLFFASADSKRTEAMLEL